MTLLFDYFSGNILETQSKITRANRTNTSVYIDHQYFLVVSNLQWVQNTVIKRKHNRIDICSTKPMVANERVDQVRVVLNAVDMANSMWNPNVVHVDMKNDQVGQIIRDIAVHAMVMADKHRMKYAMIVSDEVICKNIAVYSLFFYLFNFQKKKVPFAINYETVDSVFCSVFIIGGGGGGGIAETGSVLIEILGDFDSRVVCFR